MDETRGDTPTEPELRPARAAPREPPTQRGAVPVQGGLLEDHAYASLRRRLFGEGPELMLGSYRVLRRLGVGGMGEVHLCEDPSLGRQVALKRVLGGGETRERERLRREAQVLASLDHEHVVKVYELLELEDELYIVMEYVEGETLGQWLARQPSVVERVSHLLAAGRGLAAVHRAGFVHRDFKPDNVLVGTEGRIKIADFGLARDHDERVRRGLLDASADLPRDTREGALVGTMLYMSPEQLRGETAGATSDQFAFCIVAYEVLWGVAPFPVASLDERRAAMEAERLLRPAGSRALFRVIERGLAADATQRWANMDELLDALARVHQAPARRRRTLRSALGGAALGALLLGGAQLLAARSVPSCEQLGARAWDEPRRAALEARVLALETSDNMSARIYAGLDRWRVRHDSACVVEEQRACLAAQAQRVEVFVDKLLESEEHRRLVEAAAAVHELPNPRTCAGGLSARLVVGDNPRFATLVRELDELHAQRLLGKWTAAEESGARLERHARTFGHGPLLAEILAELAKLADEVGSFDEARGRYLEAEALALRHDRGRLAAELGLERAQLKLVEGQADAGVTELLHWSRSLQASGPVDAEARVSERFVEALLAEQSGDVQRALELLEQALAELEAEDEDAPSRRAAPALLSALAMRTLDPVQSRRRHARALELAETHFGPDHPRTALYLYNYGAALSGGSEDAKSRELRGRAVQLWKEQGPRTRRRAAVPAALFEVGELLENGDYLGAERATEHLERVVLARGGELDHERGQPDELRARAIALQVGKEPDPAGQVALRTKALVSADAAVRAYQRSGTPGKLADALRLRANLLLALGRLDSAAKSAKDSAELVVEGTLAATGLALLRAEIDLRRGALAQADAHLREAAPGVGELDSTGRHSYALLRALCSLRLGNPEAEVPAVHDTHLGWLRDELELSPEEQAWFELEGDPLHG